MSRNLTSSSCCGHIVRLADLRGKPIEFRRYGQYAPEIGTRWDCPTCKTPYFAIWRQGDEYWSEEALVDGQYKADFLRFGDQSFPNTEKGKFVIERPNGRAENAGYFVIDLSHYWAYNDEFAPEPADGKPEYLCEDNAEEVQWVWGDISDRHGEGLHDVSEEADQGAVRFDSEDEGGA